MRCSSRWGPSMSKRLHPDLDSNPVWSTQRTPSIRDRSVRCGVRRGGAPETGIVVGSEQFSSCDLQGDFAPNKIQPLPSPAVHEGVQFYSGGWDVPAEQEGEVCFAYHKVLLAQDPQSHHSIGDEILSFDSDVAEDRTFKYCAVYDNGETNSSEVRCESTKPEASQPKKKCFSFWARTTSRHRDCNSTVN